MTGRIIGALLIGILGVAALLWLGTWQLQRLAWKEGILAQIEARVGDAPVPLPAELDRATDSYRAVAVSGRFTGADLDIFTSAGMLGAGVRVIAAFETDGGRQILVDRGFVPQEDREAPRPAGPARVEGNLLWPDEEDRFTPEPDAASGLWFARDVAAMAEALATEPVLVVAREVEPAAPGITPLPVTTVGIPNNHLGYAVTWLSLAAVWAGMTGLLLWRITRRTDEGSA